LTLGLATGALEEMATAGFTVEELLERLQSINGDSGKKRR